MLRPLRSRLLAAVIAAGLATANGGPALAAAGFAEAGVKTERSSIASADEPPLPELTVSTVAEDLTNPWDLAFTPDGTMLFDQLRGGIGAVLPGGEIRTLATAADFPDNFTGNESGVMGMAVDPGFAQNRNIYLCQTLRGTVISNPGAQSRNAIVKWQINADYTDATRVGVILDDLEPQPLAADPQKYQGRHVGCRLRIDAAGLLYISVGDGRTPTGPADVTSPMGKVLRVTLDGDPAPGNPFIDNPDNTAKMVYTYGHRNPQGLAIQPSTGLMWEVEHGPDIDDEINLLQPGADYGWNPVAADGSYQDNGTPMTRAGAVAAAWSSGDPTIATSGSTFLSGSQWGAWDGAMAVATLKGVSLHLFSVTSTTARTAAATTPAASPSARMSPGLVGPTPDQADDPAALQVDEVATASIKTTAAGQAAGPLAVARQGDAAPIGIEFAGDFGRLRTAQLGPDGALYLTTSNGRGADKILRVAAAPPCAAPADEPTPSGVAAARTTSTTTAFVRATDDAVWYRSIEPGSGYSSLGGTIRYGPAVASWGGERLDVFAVGTDGSLYHRAGSSDGAFNGWEYLGGTLTSSPAVISFALNRLTIFARGTDNQLWTMSWTGTTWTDWAPAGGSVTSAPGGVVDPGSGRATIGVRGTDGRLYELRFRAAGPDGYTMIGTPLCSAPAYAARPGGAGSTTMAFRDGGRQLTVGGQPIGGTITSAPALVLDPDGAGVAAFGRGTDGALWVYLGAPGAGSWSYLGGALK